MQKRFDPGFTLIEIAIVLVIVGLLAGFGASMIVPMQKKAKRMESQKAVDAVVESILGYAFIYNRIPDEIEFRDLITNKKDPWLKDFYYLFDNRLTKNVDNYYICDNQADNAYITIHPISGIDIDNVAFVVLSSGANYNNQTRGNTKVISAVTINTATQDDIVDYFSGGGDPNRPEYYDDIVRWVTIFDLKRAADCKSKDICYGPGVRVINRYNSTLWYKILDDAVCNPVFPSAGWLNNSSVSFNSHQTFELYTNSSCSALIGQVTSTGMMYVNYHQLMSLDVNRNCVVEIIRDTFPSSTRYDIQDD